MQTLKQEVIESMNKVNQSWVDSIKEAERTSGEIDLTEINGKYSKIISELIIKFDDAENRNRNKKGFFRK